MFGLFDHFGQNARILNGAHGVFTGAIAFGFGHIENDLQPLGQAARGLVLLGPDRGQAHQDFRLADAIDRHATDFGESIVAQRVDPLLAVLGVLPSRHPVDVHLKSDLFERRNVLARVKTGVQALLGHAPILQRSIARLGQRHNIRAAQPKVGPQAGSSAPLPSPEQSTAARRWDPQRGTARCHRHDARRRGYPRACA
ncbi:hypothetical protein AQS8620_01716 [Aquimixticola soesokkakensis]|uniref:Uncharacterized protein n=1 Tax=Aquimixticola soesokkakensis TaxID=1519096 RepID=A0A1Y5SNQ3_9RHOB|nr:hypothetical protein AQS8620_01716 [Aquimixticola soesokkakensis]